MQSHFDRSNFAVEMHQCYLDLVTAGTACLLFEEAESGEPSAFRFTAIPLVQVVLEEGPAGKLDATFRRNEYTIPQLRMRFPANARIEALTAPHADENADATVAVIEAVVPERSGYTYLAVAEADALGGTAMKSWHRGDFPPRRSSTSVGSRRRVKSTVARR
jgi:head-to-tail connecting protein